jgi:hypothetical protein
LGSSRREEAAAISRFGGELRRIAEDASVFCHGVTIAKIRRARYSKAQPRTIALLRISRGLIFIELPPFG